MPGAVEALLCARPKRPSLGLRAPAPAGPAGAGPRSFSLATLEFGFFNFSERPRVCSRVSSAKKYFTQKKCFQYADFLLLSAKSFQTCCFS